MKKHLFSFFMLVASLSLFTGCKKSNNTTPPAKTKTEIISTGTWKFSTATVSGMNVASYIQACQRDNTITFQANGGGTIDEGASKCNSGDPQTTPFTWNFTNSESILHISTVLFSGGNSDFNVLIISETQLVGSQTVDFGGGAQNVIVTFIH